MLEPFVRLDWEGIVLAVTKTRRTLMRPAYGGSLVMGQAIAVRTDLTKSEVRRFARRARDAAQARRLLAIAGYSTALRGRCRDPGWLR